MVGNEMGDTKTAGWVKYRKGWVWEKRERVDLGLNTNLIKYAPR